MTNCFARILPLVLALLLAKPTWANRFDDACGELKGDRYARDQYEACINAEIYQDCEECFMIAQDKPNPWLEVTRTLAGPLALLGSSFLSAHYGYKSSKQWANAYKEGHAGCTTRFNKFMDYSLERGAPPVLPEQAAALNQCNTLPMGAFAGFGGAGNPWLGAGYSQGFMQGMVGPYFGGRAGISAGINVGFPSVQIGGGYGGGYGAGAGINVGLPGVHVGGGWGGPGFGAGAGINVGLPGVHVGGGWGGPGFGAGAGINVGLPGVHIGAGGYGGDGHWGGPGYGGGGHWNAGAGLGGGYGGDGPGGGYWGNTGGWNGAGDAWREAQRQREEERRRMYEERRRQQEEWRRQQEERRRAWEERRRRMREEAEWSARNARGNAESAQNAMRGLYEDYARASQNLQRGRQGAYGGAPYSAGNLGFSFNAGVGAGAYY